MNFGLKRGPKKGLPELGSRLKRPNKIEVKPMMKIGKTNPGLGKLKL